ncbi:hypothetical protein D3C76_295680 [compost metagenome]
MEMTLYGVAVVLIVAAVFIAMLSIVYMSVRNGISPMPSSFAVRRAVAAEIHSFPRIGTIVEAGSGWGTLAFLLAKQSRRVRQEAEPEPAVIGIENSAVPLLVSKLLRIMLGEGRVSFTRRDIYTYPYQGADIVVCYLFPQAMHKLSGIFRERLSLGTRIISVCFALPGWVPDKVIVCEDLYRTKIYIYSVSWSV